MKKEYKNNKKRIKKSRKLANDDQLKIFFLE